MKSGMIVAPADDNAENRVREVLCSYEFVSGVLVEPHPAESGFVMIKPRLRYPVFDPVYSVLRSAPSSRQLNVLLRKYGHWRDRCFDQVTVRDYDTDEVPVCFERRVTSPGTGTRTGLFKLTYSYDEHETMNTLVGSVLPLPKHDVVDGRVFATVKVFDFVDCFRCPTPFTVFSRLGMPSVLQIYFRTFLFRLMCLLETKDDPVIGAIRAAFAFEDPNNRDRVLRIENISVGDRRFAVVDLWDCDTVSEITSELLKCALREIAKHGEPR